MPDSAWPTATIKPSDEVEFSGIVSSSSSEEQSQVEKTPEQCQFPFEALVGPGGWEYLRK